MTSAWLRRLLYLLRHSRRDAELREEIEAHRALRQAHLEREGLTSAQASDASRRAVGNVLLAREDAHEVWLGSWPSLRQDIGYALRTFRNSSTFTAVSVLTLALGIGATTTMFTVASAVLLRALPYANAARIVQIVENVPAEESLSGRPVRRSSMNVDEFDWWRKNLRAVEAMAITSGETRTITTTDGTVRLEGQRVSPALFAMRNVPPIRGRWLRLDEERGNANVVVLSALTWQRYFAGDEDIVGREILLDGQFYTVVGVMPPAFGEQAFWRPFVVEPPQPGTIQFLNGSALLRAGVSLDDATAEVNALAVQLRGLPAAAPGTPPRFEVVRAVDRDVVLVRPALQLLIGAVGVVLLIVCANVANLLLVRGAGRYKELAIRRALGATRGRIVRQLVAESVVLSLAGGLAGTVLAYGGVQFIRNGGIIDIPAQFRGALGPLGPTILPRADEVVVNPSALAFTLGLSLLTGIVFGLVPAVRLSRVDHRQAMLTSDLANRGAGGTPAARRVGYVLAVAQLGLATTLLVGSGLLLRSFVNLASVELGFDTDAQIFRLIIPGEYPRSRKLALAHEVGRQLRTIAGVQAAGFVNFPPMMPLSGWEYLFLPASRETERGKLPDDYDAVTLGISSDYLRALGVTLVEGRWLSDDDTPERPRVVLVNRAWVRRFSPEASPIGMIVTTGGRRNQPPNTWEVVGVVDDIRLRMDSSPRSNPLSDFPVAAFVDLRQHIALTTRGNVDFTPHEEADLLMGGQTGGGLTFTVYAPSSEINLAALRAAVRQVDSRLAVEGLSTMGDIVSGIIGRQRFYALAVALFGGLAAAIALIGIYGVFAYAMTQRLQEFGVRLALGAEPRQVLGLAMRHAVVLVAVGIVAGLSGAAALTRYMSAMLAGVTPLDGRTYAAVAFAFVTAALLASYVPARRATRISPLVVLRSE